MKKVYIKDLRVGMFVEELDGPWLKTPFPLQGMLIQSPKDIKALGIYCEYVYVSSKKNMKKVLINDLELGMFVKELDRPWLETPFPIIGMEIASQEDINELGKYCQYVYISVHKKVEPPPAVEEDSGLELSDKYSTHVIPEEGEEKTKFHGDHVYDTSFTFEEEMPVAKKAHDKATLLINQIKEDIDRDFKLDLDIAKELVDVIAASIIKNPAAMLFLNQLNAANSSHYDHALNTSIHMITFGRHLCLPTDELYILGLGGLLMDIGQLKSSENKDPSVNYNSSAEHVIEGQKILAQIPSIPQEVIQITAQHHEREDGQGYPHGLVSNQISTYARMAAIVDIYECLISQGINDCPPLSPFEALKTLWDMTRTGLNATLVQQFAHCIGLFPGGSLVELNTGEIAIVITQSRTNRLLPTVMIVLDKNKQPYDSPITVDLAANHTKGNGKAKYEIVLDLKPGAYGIDTQEYYL